MFSKIKFKYMDSRTQWKAVPRRTKSLLPRKLMISLTVCVLLLMSVIYYGIVLEHLDEIKQFVRLSADDGLDDATDIELNASVQIFDSRMLTIEPTATTKTTTTTTATKRPKTKNNEPSEQSLEIKHGKMRFMRRRFTRDLDDAVYRGDHLDPLDPLAQQYNSDFGKLKSQVRDKRTRFALSELERDYVRCKKDSKDAMHGNDCMVEFVKLYQVAKDLSEKMEKMVEMFKDSEMILKESSKSKEFSSSEMQKTDKPDQGDQEFSVHGDHIDINDQQQQEEQPEVIEQKNDTNFHVKTHGKNETVEKFTKTENHSTTITSPSSSSSSSSSTTTSSSSTTTTTTKAPTISATTTAKAVILPQFKPVKISWIIDGYDELVEEIKLISKLTSTTSTTTEAIAPSITTDKPAIATKITTTTTPLVKREETTENPTDNVHKDELETRDSTTSLNAVSLSDGNEFTMNPLLSIASTGTSPSSTETDERERLRKLKFDWFVGKAEFSSEEDYTMDEYSTRIPENLNASQQESPKTPEKVSPIPMKADIIQQQGQLTTEASRKETTTAASETFVSQQRLLQNNSHPLDNPTSVENMLGSFEKVDNLKPWSYQTATSETDLYDPLLWEKKFREAADGMHPHDELLNAFEDKQLASESNFEPKLNPANMKSLSADDTQLLTLCERMAKRLRSKATASTGSDNSNMDANFDGFTQMPAMQFTSRGPVGGFPVTGESMKATAQFMVNPSFGMPSIPICFYLTPANFRMPSHPASMWPSPYFGMPSIYGSPTAGLMGTGIGPGIAAGSVYFMPQNFGNTGNFFSATGAGSTQSQGPNMFPKIATASSKQQQFYCTYMQNNSNQGSTSGGSSGGGSSNANSFGSNAFSNGNFKQRAANQTSPLNIIYASYVGLPSQLDQKQQKQQQSKFSCQLAGQVACYGGNECIRESSWCDNIVDCSDGSDESACTCQDRLPSDRICDGYSDCPMGEDEIGCFGCESFMYSCYANSEEYEHSNRSTISMCFNTLERCDGIQNCLNGRDERECSILVNDLTLHMAYAVSASEGFLYHNYRGEWFPVCNNGHKWAMNACQDEGGYLTAPNVTSRVFALPGPFIEPSQLGEAHFTQSCQKRSSVDSLADHSTYVRCAVVKCGSRKKSIPASHHRAMRSKRSSTQWNRMPSVAVNEPERIDVTTNDAERIVGGKYTKPMEWPFVVAIYRNGNFHCGGTIYSANWIISAAHCVINYQNYYYEVRAGLLRRSSYSATTQIQAVSHIAVHQAYERHSMRNDLSLLRLAEPLKFNRWIKPICLPDIGRTTNGKDWVWGPESNTLCTAVGWGAIREKGPASDKLRQVVIPIRKRCKDKIDQESENVCAGDLEGGRDACQGDSGGPLFCRSVSNSDEWYLAGVVSHGNGCARSGEFGVYTRVALYIDWIELATKPDMLSKRLPLQACPGYVCVWGGKHCIPKRKRCNRIVDCLGGEDEVGCVYNFIQDVGSALNITTPMSDYFLNDEITTEAAAQLENEKLIFSSSTIVMPEASDRSTTTKNPNRQTSVMPFSTEESIEIVTQSSYTEGISDRITESIIVSQETTLQTTAATTSRLNTTNSPPSTDLPSNDVMNESSSTTRATITMSPISSTDPTITSTISTTSTTQASIRITTEAPQTAPKNATTLALKFVCRRIPQIIELKHRCDRLVDCEDGTDEENCNCRDYLKGTLSILVCDGKADCEDGSDEDDCGECKSSEFLCPLSKSCIPNVRRCDNIDDCQFKEDEMDCFALTNGKELKQDINKRPVLSNFGIFTRNRFGTWRIVCMEETLFESHNVKTASEICSLLGFRGFKFYNITNTIRRDAVIVPIDPEMIKERRIKSHLAAAVEDSFHFSSVENIFPIELQPNSRTEQIKRTVEDNCRGIYVECNAASISAEPQKTLTAGNIQIPNSTNHAIKLKPELKYHKKPYVYVKPEVPMQLIDKAQEFSHNRNKNISILANNELHEALEEMHWPWLVDIYANGRLWCVGVLLDKYWVMVHESCHFGIRLNTDYLTALVGGGKSKQRIHKSALEQIRRIDCLQSVPKSDVLLFHLERPVHFSRNILPIFLPENSDPDDEDDNDDDDDDGKGNVKRDCMAVLHDELTGLIKTVPIVVQDEGKTETCERSNNMACYRLMENTELTDEARQANSDGLFIINALSNSTNCSRFGLKNSKDFIEPIDQGILVCRDENDAWLPTALFSYNNTDCRSFRQPFGIRTLYKLFDTLQSMIDQPNCTITHKAPECGTHRCPMGKCLKDEQICNKEHDCHDGSDEDTIFCLQYKRGCEPWEMQCRSTKKCIPKSKFCDHVPDCEDFTDEPTVCSCFTYLKATDPGKICDGIRNCWDKSDESPVLCNCTAKHFSCGTSQECIPLDFVCDKEPDCPNGEDERFCFGIEQPQFRPNDKSDPDHLDPQRPPKYGQVIEQSYGVWHTKCFPRNSPPDISEIRQICRKLGYIPYRTPSYRLIDDAANEVVETNEPEPEKSARSFGNETIAEKYRAATKAIVVSKFSPLKLNDALTLFMKPSRPIAELVRWNATDSSRCFRLEIRCG